MININKPSIAFFVLLLALCSQVFAQQDSIQTKANGSPQKAKIRYLQISTNPSTVDLFVGKIQPDFANKPDYISPAFIPVPAGEESIIVSFFHPDYADTTINITLAANDTSFIIVALRQTYDDDDLAHKQELLKHRNRRILGEYLRWSSIAPFTISGISAIVSIYNASKAREHKHAMENTRFMNDKYDKHARDFKDHRESARTAKNVSGIFLGTGLALLTAGFVLSF